MHDTTSKALSAFQISHRSPLLSPSLLWPDLTHHERDYQPPTALGGEMGSLSITFSSVGNKMLGNIFQS